MNLALRHVGNHDHVVLLAQVPAANVGVIEAGERKLVLLQNPARPAFVDARDPRAVQSDAQRPSPACRVSLAVHRAQMVLAQNRVQLRLVDVRSGDFVAGERHRALRGQNLVDGAEAGIRAVVERRGQTRSSP